MTSTPDDDREPECRECGAPVDLIPCARDGYIAVQLVCAVHGDIGLENPLM